MHATVNICLCLHDRKGCCIILCLQQCACGSQWVETVVFNSLLPPDEMGSRDQTQIIRHIWQVPLLLNHLTSLVSFFFSPLTFRLFSQVGVFPQILTSLVFCLTLVPTLTGILGGLFVKRVCKYICVPLVEAGGQLWMSSSGMPFMSFETKSH